MVAAYGEFASSLVDWGKDWMRMQSIQELQFTGWSDPAAAAREASRDSKRAWGLLEGAQNDLGAATKVHVANEATLIAARKSKFLEHRRRRRDDAGIKTRRVGAEQEEERQLALESERDSLARARAAYDEIYAEFTMSRRAVVAAEKRIGQAQQMIALASAKEQAVDAFAEELRRRSRS